MEEPKIITLIMAGGYGKRFWPLSKKNYPKQFLCLTSKKPLITETISRISSMVSDIFICGLKQHEPLFKKLLPKPFPLILEPMSKNTAHCLILSACYLSQREYDEETLMIVLPSDHYIPNEEKFRETLKVALKTAKNNNTLVTIGISPTHPHTGYGYILREKDTLVSNVKRFTEKPSLKEAQELLKNKALWNSGIFVWKLGTLVEAFQKFMPYAFKTLQKAAQSDLQSLYQELPSTPIDQAVLEKADNVQVVFGDFTWNDLGSWSSLLAIKPSSTPAAGIKNIHSQECYSQTENIKKIAFVGVENLIVIEHEGNLLITQKEKDQLVGQVSDYFDVDEKDLHR